MSEAVQNLVQAIRAGDALETENAFASFEVDKGQTWRRISPRGQGCSCLNQQSAGFTSWPTINRERIVLSINRGYQR